MWEMLVHISEIRKLISNQYIYIMFGMFKRVGIPIANLGRKLTKIFGIGRKSTLVSDARNLEQFENLAPSGLRQRAEKPSDLLGADGGFYGNMTGYLSSFKYPV